MFRYRKGKHRCDNRINHPAGMGDPMRRFQWCVDAVFSDIPPWYSLTTVVWKCTSENRLVSLWLSPTNWLIYEALNFSNGSKIYLTTSLLSLESTFWYVYALLRGLLCCQASIKLSSLNIIVINKHRCEERLNDENATYQFGFLFYRFQLEPVYITSTYIDSMTHQTQIRRL